MSYHVLSLETKVHMYFVLHLKVQVKKMPEQTYALKQLDKWDMVRNDREESVFNETMILMKSRCDFIVRFVPSLSSVVDLEANDCYKQTIFFFTGCTKHCMMNPSCTY